MYTHDIGVSMYLNRNRIELNETPIKVPYQTTFQLIYRICRSLFIGHYIAYTFVKA